MNQDKVEENSEDLEGKEEIDDIVGQGIPINMRKEEWAQGSRGGRESFAREASGGWKEKNEPVEDSWTSGKEGDENSGS